MHPEKRSRRKPIKSCLECNRRKQKCNRQKPCNHCLGRGVQRLCVYSVLRPHRSRSRSRYLREGRASSAKAHSEKETSTTLSSCESDIDQTELDGFDPLGYQSSGSSRISPHAPQAFYPSQPSRAISRKHRSHSSSRPREWWPDRSMTDFLVGIFLQDINGIYETIHPPSFQPRYASWWIAQENIDRSGDTIQDEYIDFGLLVLRVCLLSIQSLSHSKLPTTEVLSRPEAMEQWYSSLADELEKSRPPEKMPTMETVQHKILHGGYLKNYGKIRKSWSVLNTAVKNAHEMGLHLKDLGLAISELDMELRRRTFWNLYVWDRFMCTFFGHWPLIPEGYFDIEPPYDNLQALTTSPYVLTPFTDRVFHIKLARYLTAFMSPPFWKSDRHDPAAVSKFAQHFHQVIIDQLPPPFSLESPDNSWDAVESALIPKREILSLFIYTTRASLYRSFMDPCRSLHPNQGVRSMHGPDLLALSHRRALMDTTCKMLSCIARLYAVTGSEGLSAERLFLLPVSLVDALASLGVCLLSIQADERRLSMEGIQTITDSDLQRSYETFFDAFGLLYQQAPHDRFAKRGVKALEGLHGALRDGLSGTDPLEANPTGTDMMGSFSSGQTHPTGYFQLEQALMSLHANGGGEIQGCTFIALPEWLPSFLESPARSWLFHGQAVLGDILA